MGNERIIELEGYTIFRDGIPAVSHSGRRGPSVGIIAGNVLIKTVKGSKHRLRHPEAWALDMAVLQQALEQGVERVRIVDEEDGKVYEVALKTFLRKGVLFDRGHGTQLYLEMRWWMVNAFGVLQLELFA